MCSILLLHKYGISTDIEKAFLHVTLDEKDRDYTRFLWLSNPTDPESVFNTYRFKSVLFGSVSSPARSITFSLTEAFLLNNNGYC